MARCALTIYPYSLHSFALATASPTLVRLAAKRFSACCTRQYQFDEVLSLIARLRRCDNSYIAWLCARCRALKTNDHSAPVGKLISSAFLMIFQEFWSGHTSLVNLRVVIHRRK